MARAGFHLNDKQKYRRNGLYCTLPIIAAFVIMLISICTDTHYGTENPFFVFFQRSVIHACWMSFIILLRSFYERLAMINSHLRYSIILLPEVNF